MNGYCPVATIGLSILDNPKLGLIIDNIPEFSSDYDISVYLYIGVIEISLRLNDSPAIVRGYGYHRHIDWIKRAYRASQPSYQVELSSALDDENDDIPF